MKTLAACFCNQTDIGASVAPICRVVESCLDLELLYGVGVGNRNPATARGTALYVTYTNSVQLEIVVIGARPVHINPIVGGGDLRQCGPSRTELTCVVHSRRNAGREACELGKISRDQRQA